MTWHKFNEKMFERNPLKRKGRLRSKFVTSNISLSFSILPSHSYLQEAIKGLFTRTIKVTVNGLNEFPWFCSHMTLKFVTKIKCAADKKTGKFNGTCEQYVKL